MAYERQYYTNGDVLEARQLNHMETGIKENSDNIDKHSEDIATKASAIKEKASGEVIVVTDSDEQKPLGLAIDGKSEQNQYSGNQLANLPEKESVITQGITWSCKNGIVTAIGTATDGSYSSSNGLNYDMPPIAGNFFVSGSTNNVNIYLVVTKADGTNQTFNEQSFTLDGTETRVRLYCFVAKGATVNTTVYPMLNVGETALPWEPYCGGIPSPSTEYQQEITNTGKYDEASGKYVVGFKFTKKNLLNVNAIKMASDDLVNGLKWVINADGSITVSGTPTDTWSNISEMFNYLPFKSGKQYIFSVEKPLNEVKLGIKFATGTSDRESYRITKGSKEVSFKLTKDREYTSFFIEELVAGTEYNFTFKPMVRLAEITDDTYEPFQEATDTVLLDEPLRKGDKAYWNGGSKLRIDRYSGVATENDFTEIQPLGTFGRFVIDTLPPLDITKPLKCTKFKGVNFDGRSNYSIYPESGRNAWTCAFKTDSTENSITNATINDIKENIIIEYTLAEPITEEIDIDLGELTMFYPTTILSNDCNANMEVTYIADTKAYIDKKFAELATAMV